MKYGKVIINSRTSKLDKLFTYIINENHTDIAKVGMRVLVPFGRGNKIIVAFLVDIVDVNADNHELKEIIDFIDDKPLVSQKLIDLGFWMKNEYLSTYLDAFQPILPPGDFKNVKSFITLNNTNYNSNNEDEDKIIKFLDKNGTTLLSEIKDELNIRNINFHINNLENKGIIDSIIDIQTKVSKKRERWVKINKPELTTKELEAIIDKRYHGQRKIAKYLLGKKNILLVELLKELATTLNTVKALEEKGIVSIYDEIVFRSPIERNIDIYEKHELTLEQRHVYDRIHKAIEEKSSARSYLIHGITGSGKTEIYLQLVEATLLRGKDAIVLVPEISLTPQTIERFVGRFGDTVAILHSQLSHGERFDEWRRIREGKVKIVVGARSALFAPFQNLGIVIIDEEHETTYKSFQNPKYDSIEVAKKRVTLEDAYLIMGTATPSIETYYKAVNSDIVLLELEERVNKMGLPKISVVDMRAELKEGNRSIFSRELFDEMAKTLSNGKQIILFLNRRGFSTFVTCRECGYIEKCNSCDISLTYYKNINKLRCHYCGLTKNVPSVCPNCGSKYIKHFGIGTEKVEEYVKEIFPQARIARLDSDTTTSKDSYNKILSKMKNEEIDILIGTQMIAKGLDFNKVTLVGIIAADTTLNLPDYRSPERSFQLVTQVAGRAGRGIYGGKVVLQTYSPEHYSIIYSREQNYNEFFNTEIELRREFLYPPFINIISILIYGKNNSKVCKLSQELYNIIKSNAIELYKEKYLVHLIGPNPAPLEKINNNFRWLILLKIDDKDMGYFKDIIKRVCIYNEEKLDMYNVKVSIDINPTSIM